MNTLVINLTRLTQHPQVRHAGSDTLDSVQIVPRGRTKLREGMRIDERWLAKNPTVLRIEVIDSKNRVVTPVGRAAKPVAVTEALPVEALPASATETKGEA